MTSRIRRCCVLGCDSTNKNWHLYSFPRNDRLRGKWLHYLIRNDASLSNLTKEKLRSLRVCEKHFEKKQLKPNGKRVFYGYPTLITNNEIRHGVPLDQPCGNLALFDHPYASVQNFNPTTRAAVTISMLIQSEANNNTPANENSCGSALFDDTDASMQNLSPITNTATRHGLPTESSAEDNTLVELVEDRSKMTQIISTLPSLDRFECNGDPISVSVRWEKWKRALEIYFIAANINTPAKKRATLLHVGGPGLQEIYFNLPGAHVEETTGANVYEIAVGKLDEHFFPKQSRYYERYIFRLMKPEEGERFETFLLRLWNQAEKCKFTNTEEHMIDQIIEKGCPAELQKKILHGGDNITILQVINDAMTFEAINRQQEIFEGGTVQQTIN